jgi:hypothetical protein
MAVKPLNAAQQPRWCVQWHEAINFVAFDHPAGQISPHLDIDSWETTAHGNSRRTGAKARDGLRSPANGSSPPRRLEKYRSSVCRCPSGC